MNCAHCNSSIAGKEIWACRKCDYAVVCCSHKNKRGVYACIGFTLQPWIPHLANIQDNGVLTWLWKNLKPSVCLGHIKRKSHHLKRGSYGLTNYVLR